LVGSVNRCVLLVGRLTSPINQPFNHPTEKPTDQR